VFFRDVYDSNDHLYQLFQEEGWDFPKICLLELIQEVELCHLEHVSKSKAHLYFTVCQQK